MNTTSGFTHFAQGAAAAAGRPSAFVVASGTVLLWSLTGPLFGYSDTWQLVINTSTTIVTFLMVFLIQNSQNRDSRAVQLKLDELIRSTGGAHNALLDVEEVDEVTLDMFRARYRRLAGQAREALAAGRVDTGSSEE